MIMSISDLVDKVNELTDHKLNIGEIMCEYHLRFEYTGLSYPVNHIEIDTTNKAITMKFKRENILKGLGD